MAQGFMVRLRGPMALFTRPEFKVERYSYDVPTPSALAGALASIYLHPGIEWQVERYWVLNEIRRQSVAVKEVSSKASSAKVLQAAKGKGPMPRVGVGEARQIRCTSRLVDVDYVVQCRFSITDGTDSRAKRAKIASIVDRRLRRGQCYQQPYLGVREQPCSFSAWEGGVPEGHSSPCGPVDLGLVFCGMDRTDPAVDRPRFFHAVMDRGCVEVAGREVV